VVVQRSNLGKQVLPKNVKERSHESNVRGEPVFSVMAAGWSCEKSG
jgi:hypothetical protein